MLDLEERVIQKRVLGEMKKIRDKEAPPPEKEWDLVWVLSGPEITFEEERPDGRENETRGRLMTGFRLVKEITALRLNKEVSEVTVDEVRQCGPKLYFDGWADQNKNIQDTIGSGVIEREFGIPKENIIIGSGEGIERTPDQFKRFPPDLVANSKKIVVVTDAYHIPRTRRIAKRSVIDEEPDPISPEILIFYRSDFSRFPLRVTRGEIRKIPQLIGKGFLPKEE